jgi:uncharacterized caspase-like protein
MGGCAVKKLLSFFFILATLCVAPDVLAEPVRLLVAAGHKVGLQAEHPLKYADNDASKVRDVLVGLGGVKAENATVLAEPTRAQLFAALDKVRDEARKHSAQEVTLLFYFSGHGDRDAIHLGDERVLLSDLSAKLAEIPAGLRIAVTDACRATREKGFSADEPFAISAATIPQASGQVWLHASSDGEAAQESDELQGAIFTHAWLNGLRGAADSNGDARVTLDESFAFAHSQTLIRSAKSSGVLQKPEAVVSLREGAPVVITQTAATMATLSLPQSRDTHFLVYAAGAKSVLSELWGSPDRRIALRVPPGRYVIHKRANGTGALAQIAIGEGEERKIEDRDFSASSLETLAQKGDAVEPDAANRAPDARTRHEIYAGWDAGGNLRSGFVQGPHLAYAYTWSRVALVLGGGAEFGSRDLSNKEERLVSGFGRAAIEVRIPIGMVTLHGDAGARGGVMAQNIRPSANSPAPPQSNTAFTLGPEVGLGARLGVARSLFADVGATGSMMFLREEGSLRGIAGLTGGISLGARF